MATIINGSIIASDIRKELKEKIDKYDTDIPCLMVILVGDRPDSSTYVRMKQRAAKEIGIEFRLHTFANDVNESELISYIDQYNENRGIHGIIVQLPLPKHLDQKKICQLISLDKDVDGLRSENISELVVSGTPKFISCTPLGCMEMLKRYNIKIQGQNAVVIGRSNMVGLPVSFLLLHENATVTICHHYTPERELVKVLNKADIVVVAVGIPYFIKGIWLKPGATVIDVGINAIPDNTTKRGYRLVGDVEYDIAIKQLGEKGHVTPVPGGVGPVTVSMLLSNTVKAFEKSLY